MAEKVINGRIAQKHDTPENWAKATNFIPLKGEIIIYDATAESYPKIKVGDGVTTINGLPFIDEYITLDEVDAICGLSLSLAEAGGMEF